MEIIERTVAASPTHVWDLWTTGEGISRWWAPTGFRTDVTGLELVVGGELSYTMTAVAPEQIAFLQQYGMPLATDAHKYFTEIEEPSRLAYRSVIDFLPDHAPYEQLTIVDLEPAGDGTRIVMQIEPLHDEVWTRRLIDGRTNELAKLERLVADDTVATGFSNVL